MRHLPFFGNNISYHVMMLFNIKNRKTNSNLIGFKVSLSVILLVKCNKSEYWLKKILITTHLYFRVPVRNFEYSLEYTIEE